MSAMKPPGHGSRPEAVRRLTTKAALMVLVFGGAQLFAPMAGASTVPTTGLTLVHVTSHTLPPPPSQASAVFLKTGASLAAFAGTLRADDVGIHLPPSGPGRCKGGTHYTVELTYKSGHKKLLEAYECGSAVRGNLTGNVHAFVKYLSTLVN